VCVVDDFLRRQIALVTDQQLVHVLGGITVNLLKPCLDVCERFLRQNARIELRR
jgi:hypothetical protein